MSDIRQILGKVFEAAGSTPVEIREPDYTLVSRGSLANIGDMAHSLPSGEYLTNISLPLGVNIIQPISITADGSIDLEKIAHRVISTIESSENYKAIIEHPLVTEVVKSTTFGAILENISYSHLNTPASFGSLPAGLEIESMGPTEQGKEIPGTVNGATTIWIRVFKDAFTESQFNSSDPKPLLTSSKGGVCIENRTSLTATLQLLQVHEPALNIIIPSQSSVVVLKSVAGVGLNTVTELGVPVVDELIRLRSAGRLSELIGVATSLTESDIISIAEVNATAAIATVYIVLQVSELTAIRKIIARLAETAPDTDTYVLQAELAARDGQHKVALEQFLSAAEMGLPKFSFGLSKLVDRLRFYLDVEESKDTITGEKVFSALKKAQPFASRCDFNLLFTNYTGLSPAQPNEAVLDGAAIAATGAAPYSIFNLP
ncbi:hypothetical protein [Nitrosospira sp. NRS527]|uniref:hypothetical protein n=1 Tax=Nitrosospira sp. NRS527 TaxID=155925 RepID=UPI001AF1BE1E|nr:hypothetical protein [Nitrosospira sp. NRS527]BCT67322.1 hypothetical protein NNRS527_00904 [Nitrosospira sp. NRS527]